MHANNSRRRKSQGKLLAIDITCNDRDHNKDEDYGRKKPPNEPAVGVDITETYLVVSDVVLVLPRQFKPFGVLDCSSKSVRQLVVCANLQFGDRIGGIEISHPTVVPWW